MIYLNHKADQDTAEVFRFETILKLAKSFNERPTFNVSNRPSKLAVTDHSLQTHKNVALLQHIIFIFYYSRNAQTMTYRQHFLPPQCRHLALLQSHQQALLQLFQPILEWHLLYVEQLQNEQSACTIKIK